MRAASLQGAFMLDSGLRRANLDDADLRQAQLKNTDLRNSLLRRSNFDNADLRNAVFLNSVMENASLENADMTSTNLQGADLRRAVLYGTNLKDANLEGTDLDEALIDDKTIIKLPEIFHISNGRILRIKDYSYTYDGDKIIIESIDNSEGVGNKHTGLEKKISENITKPAPALHTIPDDRIGYRGGKVPTGSTIIAKSNSLAKLEKLQEELEKFHGNDEEFFATPNTEEMPLSKDDLEVLKKTVDASIALHKLPSFPPEIINALKELMNYLKSIAKYLAGIKIKKVAYLTTALNQSWELIEKFLSSLD